MAGAREREKVTILIPGDHLMRRRLLLILLVSSWLGTSSWSQTEEPKPTREEQEVIDRTNAERKKAERKPLVANRKLMTAAREHAANMAKQGKLEHTLDDKGFEDRAKDAGYSFAALGENIAWNDESPKAVVETWMGSQLHKDNILNEEFTEIGVAVAQNAKGERYWVQVFGKPLK
jgi:uncharacterized protein YkwD